MSCQAKFQQQAVAHRNVQILRAELERAFKSDRRENTEGIEVLIREMFEELCELEEDRWKDLEILKAHLVDARKNKEAQEVFELQQIIEVVSESLQKTGPQPSVNTSPAKVFECPIGLAIMEDPVVLLDSGMTYERDNILEWKLTYVDSRIIACASLDNHPRFTELSGLFIAKQNMKQDYRDHAICFVTLSSDPANAAELGFFYV